MGILMDLLRFGLFSLNPDSDSRRFCDKCLGIWVGNREVSEFHGNGERVFDSEILQ